MSLILCRQEPVRHPFYIERLGVHIASSQELCYVIYQNPLLVLDGFVDDRLIEFIRSELGLSFLAGKLEAWQRSGESQDELPIVILQECCYYTAKEIAAYRMKLAAFRKRMRRSSGRRRRITISACGSLGRRSITTTGFWRTGGSNR